MRWRENTSKRRSVRWRHQKLFRTLYIVMWLSFCGPRISWSRTVKTRLCWSFENRKELCCSCSLWWEQSWTCRIYFEQTQLKSSLQKVHSSLLWTFKNLPRDSERGWYGNIEKSFSSTDQWCLPPGQLLLHLVRTRFTIQAHRISCNYHKFLSRRYPWKSRRWTFVIGRMHFKNHKHCSLAYNMDSYKCSDGVNSHVCEQRNHSLQKISSSMEWEFLVSIGACRAKEFVSRRRSVRSDRCVEGTRVSDKSNLWNSYIIIFLARGTCIQ